MPNITTIHVNTALTNLSIKFGQGEFISEVLAPRVSVLKKSDVYYTLDELREELRAQETQKASGAPATAVDFEVGNTTYTCVDHALKALVTSEERANVDPALQADIEKTEFLTNLIKVRKEIDLASALDTAVSGATPPTKWDLNTSDPVADIKLGQVTIVDAVQKQADLLTIPWEVFMELKDHPNIIERVKAGGTMSNAAVVNAQALAQVFGIDRVVIASAYKNTAAHGATATTSNIWSDTCYLSISPTNPGLRTQAMALTFGWAKPGTNMGHRVRQWNDPELDGDFVEVSDYYDQKVIGATAGYKLSSVLT